MRTITMASTQRVLIACAMLSVSVLSSAQVQSADATVQANTSQAATPPAQKREFMLPGFTEPDQVDALLAQPEDQIDFAKVKLTIDRMIDPRVDVDANLKRIDDIAAQIWKMAGPVPSSRKRLLAIKQYLYEAGPWNDYEPYHYDFTDPFGEKNENKLVSSYLARKLGNCVSMPLLFLILSQKLGIDVSASTAPHHILVKYTDDRTRTAVNLEPTSGANPIEESYYQKLFPIPDEAFSNSVYFQRLTKKETVAVMASSLAELHFGNKEYEKAIDIANIVLAHYPKYLLSMRIKGAAYYRIFQKMCPVGGYSAVPFYDPSFCDYLYRSSSNWLANAQRLGWREPSQEQKAFYLQTIQRGAQAYSN